jgi:DHA2 family multidrug resistance protein
MVLSPGGLVMMVLMPVAGVLVAKMDPRLLVSMGYAVTAVTLFNLTHLDLNVSFAQITTWRALQVVGLPFIFIPISTLNYVGVPRDKNNQISSFSNFARNIGGSMGTAMLTTFLTRTAQTHQNTLASNTGSTVAYNTYIDQTKAALMALGQGADQAKQAAIGHAYTQMLQQASMLSYMNAFWVLSLIIACLVPLPFIMRRPPARAKAPVEAAAH